MAELDLFSAPMTQLSIENKIYTEISPMSAITDWGPEFFIPGDVVKQLDLNGTLLHFHVKFINANIMDLANNHGFII